MDSCLVVVIASTLLSSISSLGDTAWPSIYTKYCNGSRQSPIDIVSASAKMDPMLTDFTFTKFGLNSSMTNIVNTGRTVQVNLASGLQVSGGGLSEAYDTLRFHLHWGNGSSSPGSEHTVDGKRYPMELHIANVKSSLNRNRTLVLADPTGLASLGFFIEAASGNGTDSPSSWKTLTSFLTSITKEGDIANLPIGVSLDDLLTGVDRTKYYRYQGSVSAPTCNEVVVWTVFKDSIKISQNMIDLFHSTVRINDTNSILIVNNYRGIQPLNSREVTYSGSGRGSGSS